MFDARVLSLAPFVPHDFATLERAYPPGSISEAMYENIRYRYAHIDDVSIQRQHYRVDDVEVTGVMLAPTNVTPGTHPILIFNRGGNGAYGIVALPLILRYMLPFAQQGYLVFASNYRGNDGGTGQEEFGGADVDDVLTLLDIARHHPGWDGKNAFMLGASRGGMMTTIAIKNGAKLNAAATFGGVTDVWAMVTERPEMEEKVHATRMPGFAENRAAHYDARSAVQWPEALREVPLLLMHGGDDTIVFPSHTEALATALEAANAPHKKVIYPGGNHPLSTHSAAMIQETMDWFTAHRG